MRIAIWSIAKKTDPLLEVGIREYADRLSRYIPLQMELIAPASPMADAQAARKIEADRILQRLKAKDCLVLLDERGHASPLPNGRHGWPKGKWKTSPA